MVVHDLAAQASVTLKAQEVLILKDDWSRLVFCWISLLITHVIYVRELKQVKWLQGSRHQTR